MQHACEEQQDVRMKVVAEALDGAAIRQAQPCVVSLERVLQLFDGRFIKEKRRTKLKHHDDLRVQQNETPVDLSWSVLKEHSITKHGERVDNCDRTDAIQRQINHEEVGHQVQILEYYLNCKIQDLSEKARRFDQAVLVLSGRLACLFFALHVLQDSCFDSAPAVDLAGLHIQQHRVHMFD